MAQIEIIDTTLDDVPRFGVCGYKSMKQVGLVRKMAWLEDRFAEGLKIMTLYSAEHGTQGMIEYLPGEKCWRPVDAAGHLFIHCFFVGFKSQYKNKGYGSLMIAEVLNDARVQKYHGVAVVTREGSWMAGRDIFTKNGFTVVDTAPPDFELLVHRFDSDAPTPKFKRNWETQAQIYNQGLYIFRSDQCPYLAKSVPEIIDVAEQQDLHPQVIEMQSYADAQNCPCAFGTFGVIWDGKVVAHNPISKTHFLNILKNKQSPKKR